MRDKKVKEIGGYLQLEQYSNKEYYTDMLRLNTGRNALVYILKAKKIKKLYIPRYICDSIIKILKKYNYCYEFYDLDNSLRPIVRKDMNLDAENYIYIINYFAQLDEQDIKGLYFQFPFMILDNVQAFFQKPISGIPTIYSCRKFFGVADGSYVAIDTYLKEVFMQDQSAERMEHIIGRYEGHASTYYNKFVEVEQNFEKEEIKYMSNLTRNLLCSIDYSNVLKRRNENFAFLQERLTNLNMLDVKQPVGPYAYPFLIEDGEELKHQLIQRAIYIPTLWPNVLNQVNQGHIEYQFAQNLLALPCDQRYGRQEMQLIVDTINSIIK